MSSAMALCVLLSNFSSFFATSRFRSLELESHIRNTVMLIIAWNYALYTLGKSSYQSGFLGARLAKSWGRERVKSFTASMTTVTSTEGILYGRYWVFTTSSMMGSGLAASNWSFTLSSTGNKVHLLPEVICHRWQKQEDIYIYRYNIHITSRQQHYFRFCYFRKWLDGGWFLPDAGLALGTCLCFSSSSSGV